ncbi:uncharacterized protein DDB_G0286299-like isoform X2 [Oscarella lobularis]|uniref:uncharacterized protein DDB_G0286299-like isoform X2 n=1 Tax=Oscarella lobularis TaxID=121494 RepID=UPI003313E5EF
MALVADGTLNCKIAHTVTKTGSCGGFVVRTLTSSAANFNTAVNGVFSGTLRLGRPELRIGRQGDLEGYLGSVNKGKALVETKETLLPSYPDAMFDSLILPHAKAIPVRAVDGRSFSPLKNRLATRKIDSNLVEYSSRSRDLAWRRERVAMVKKRSSKHKTAQDEMPGDDATSKSPSPEPDKGAHATSSPPVAEATRGERKKSWFKRLFPGKSQKQKEREAMRRSRSEPTAVKLVTSDNSSTDREMSPTPALGTLPETDDSPVDDPVARMTPYRSSPSLMPTFRKRPVTVHVADDVWAQVKAKQEALFSDGSFLKVDAGAAISSRTPPVHRHSYEEETRTKAEKFDVTDEEWQKVKAAQERMFSKVDDSALVEKEISTMKQRESRSPSVELTEVLTIAKSEETLSPVAVVSSAAQVRAALARKEEEEKMKQKLAAETLAKRQSYVKEAEDKLNKEKIKGKEEEEEEKLEEHEFFTDCAKEGNDDDDDDDDEDDDVGDDGVEQKVDEQDVQNIEEHEFFAAEVEVQDRVEKRDEIASKKEEDEEKTPSKFNELVRQQSLKLRESRQSRMKKRHTIASPGFLEGEEGLWDEIQSKHVSLFSDPASLETRERLDDKEVDQTEMDEILSDVKVRKSGVVVGRRKSDTPRFSVLPSAEETAEVSPAPIKEKSKTKIYSEYTADLTAIPQLQPSLGLSAGHMKRNVSRKHKRRPPSIRLSSPPSHESGNPLFASPERAVAEEQETDQSIPVSLTKQEAPRESPKEKELPQQSSWLQELQKRQSIKSEGIGSSATLPYKKKTSQPIIGSTAALVAMAAKKRTSKESLVSFNERAESQAKPKPKAMVIHEKSGSNSKEVSAPEWIKMAQKINERRVVQKVE